MIATLLAIRISLVLARAGREPAGQTNTRHDGLSQGLFKSSSVSLRWLRCSVM